MTSDMSHLAAAQVVDDVPNRGMDTKLNDGDQRPLSVTLMSIDELIVNHLTTVIKPTIVDNGAIKPVAVQYGSPERWAAVRQHGALRDPATDKAQTPLILLRRVSVDRGKLSNPSNKYVSTSWETGWNARNAYDKFSVLNNIRPSKQFHSIIIPDYVDLQYEFMVWTEYEEQMSDLIGQLQMEADDFWGVRNGFKFRVKIDKFDSQSDLDATQDRVIRTQFSMKVSAYLIPDRMVQKYHISPTTQKMYTAKKVIVMTETVTTK
jgi:hypothetical protein